MFNTRTQKRVYKKILEYQSDKPRFEDFYYNFLKEDKIKILARDVWWMQVRYVNDEQETYFSPLATKWGTERLTNYRLDKTYNPNFFLLYIRSKIPGKLNDRQWEVAMKLLVAILGIIAGLTIYHFKECNCP